MSTKDEIISVGLLNEVLLEFADTKIYNELTDILLREMPAHEAASYRRMIAGEELPPLISDVIAKKIFSPDENRELTEFLLREVTGDHSISVSGGAPNEGYSQNRHAKKMIFDVPITLLDRRRVDFEFQMIAQDFSMTRAELYASDMLMIQYSVDSNDRKGNLSYDDVRGVILVIFMRNSPKDFAGFNSRSHIHRFNSWVSDTGMQVESLRNIIFVQLDKALAQFHELHMSGREPSALDTLLALMADVNDKDVQLEAEKVPVLSSICSNVSLYVQEKEVQTMLLAEKFAQADLNAMRTTMLREGLEQGLEQGRAQGLEQGRAQGLEQGRAQGRVEGSNEMLYSLAARRKISLEDAAEEAGVDVDTFRAQAKLCGFDL